MTNTASPYGSYKVSQYSECTHAVHTQWLFPCILEHHQKLYFLAEICSWLLNCGLRVPFYKNEENRIIPPIPPGSALYWLGSPIDRMYRVWVRWPQCHPPGLTFFTSPVHMFQHTVRPACPGIEYRRWSRMIKEALADPKHLIRKDRYEGTPLEYVVLGRNLHQRFEQAIWHGYWNNNLSFYVLPRIAPGRLEIGMTCPQTLQIP